MLPAHRIRYSWGEYLALEAASNVSAVVNPTLLCEVLSRSTEQYDRGDRFEHYKRIPALRQYVLVSHDSREVEVWTRDDAGVWSTAVARDGEQAGLTMLGAVLDVRVLYDAAAEPGP